MTIDTASAAMAEFDAWVADLLSQGRPLSQEQAEEILQRIDRVSHARGGKWVGHEATEAVVRLGLRQGWPERAAWVTETLRRSIVGTQDTL